MKETKVHVLLRGFESLLLVCALAVCSFRVSAADLTQPNLTQAEELYKHTDYEQSLALLDKGSSDAATAFLVGRDYFMLGDFKKSTEALQRAVAAEPASSEYFDWLGRALGRRAETANFVSAIGLASKTRQAFERSVQLDPKNSDALSDLFDYYLEAPGFLGGGYDKALAVAEKISAVDTPEGYFAKAKLAQKQKEFSIAEQHLRQSVAAGPHQVGHIIALAKFLANEGRTSESDQMFLAARRADPNAAQVWFAQADVLIKQNRDLEEAKNLLQKYMNAPITVDDPPKQEAARLLKQVGGA